MTRLILIPKNGICNRVKKTILECTHTINMYIIIVVHMVDCLQQASNLSHSSPSDGEHKHYTE